jgi:hypothetical protein
MLENDNNVHVALMEKLVLKQFLFGENKWLNRPKKYQLFGN